MAWYLDSQSIPKTTSKSMISSRIQSIEYTYCPNNIPQDFISLDTTIVLPQRITHTVEHNLPHGNIHNRFSMLVVFYRFIVSNLEKRYIFKTNEKKSIIWMGLDLSECFQWSKSLFAEFVYLSGFDQGHA